MMVHLAKEIITEMLQSSTVPGKQEAIAILEEELRQKVGIEVCVEDLPDLQQYGRVDDFYASLEWSAGGLVHVHIAYWIVGAPRIDKVVVPRQSEAGVFEVDVTAADAVVLPHERAANVMSTFWDRVICEFNVAKHEKEGGDSDKGTLRSATGVRSTLGKKKEKLTISPESISWRTFAHCLLGSLELPTEQEETECWDELNRILEMCGRSGAPTPGSASVHERRSLARRTFVAALAEWVNMHDLHLPFPMGPPGREQACACIEDEHSTRERCSCNKLYPRKCIDPGQEEINEDPRRRELYRLWLARNCHFINNFVPPLQLALLSNMDFQATLTKDAVIEYMTKYMTKSGQGSLVKVMEHSFSLCIEKARGEMKGAGSAIIRWFNLQSLTEVKSQLETMHLLFGVPRFFCSRRFKDLWLKSEIRNAKNKAEIANSDSKDVSIAGRSGADVYIERFGFKTPLSTALLDMHPVSGRSLWREILAAGRIRVAEAEQLADHLQAVTDAWQDYLQLMSWWQLKRYFTRQGPSVKCNSEADIVVVHPVGRFTTATTDAQWRDACYWTLLAHCNHGGPCYAFRDADHLDTFSDEAMKDLMTLFADGSLVERSEKRLAPCPPHT
jgi:hypothetical protein